MKTTNAMKVGLTAAALSMLAFGCESKEQTGTVAGAGAGALAGAALGDNLVGGLIGGAVGGLVGREIGQALDERDQERMIRSFETGQPVSWQDEEYDYRYRVEPMRSFPSYRGVEGPCREFEMDIYTDRGLEQTYGVACREDGRWRVVGG